MANQERNGRNVAVPDESRPTWRPQDENGQRNRRNLTDDGQISDERSDRSTERYGQGQSGYAAGRNEGDRSYSSRNQASLRDQNDSDERGTDERFTGRGGSQWSPRDRDMAGSHGNYGHTGHWTDDAGYGSGWQGGNRASGYNEGPYGRGGEQNRYGSQGYQGYQEHNRYSGRAIGDGRHPGQHGDGQGFGPGGNGGSSGYGYQPEHDRAFRGGERGYDEGRNVDQRTAQSTGYGTRSNETRYPGGEAMYSHEAMYGRRGAHRGKGPSGYTRSDDRIREMVCDVLTDHHDIDASHIEVSVKNGEVTLAGTVEDRRTKRLAEDCIEQLSGVKEVVNQLRVSDKRTISSDRTGANAGPAIERSGTEQSPSGAHDASDKRHRA